ncbi:HNH endonuclease [Priestia megaterium]|uniref:HNH endonuclease n=1 Tax=Priestia megaterium TaxID=1404 RepID=UPI0011A5E578|nr:HNH endonuclease [Priestia megaterium]
MSQYKTKKQKIQFYKSREWQKLRVRVLKRDNCECQECKRNGSVYTEENDPEKHKRLDVDHIKDIYTHPELALDMDNLQTLCVKCHNRKHNRFQKRRKKTFWDDEKW